MVWAFFLQNLIVILIIIGLAALRSHNTKEACLKIIAAWLLMVGIFVAGLWYYPPSVARWGIAAVLLVVSALHLKRVEPLGSFSIFRISHLATLASSSLGAVLIWQGVAGRVEPPLAKINLAPPMSASSNICVVSGGSTLALNLHFLTSAAPEGQFEKHSVDFVKHDSWGNRMKRLGLHPQPQEIENYLVFGEPVYAPCQGRVIAMENAKSDHPAGRRFRDKSGSNYVTLRCGNTDVVLAHLKEGSLVVRLGQEVNIGYALGKIGHSGNTEEPHLHINAQTVVPDDRNETNPEPVIMTFDGRYLARGDCL